MDNNKTLQKRVLYFITQQPGYNPDTAEEIRVINNNDNYGILYGESIDVGIVGMGESEDEAFDDFIKKWYSFNGFEWIKKTKMVSDL